MNEQQLGALDGLIESALAGLPLSQQDLQHFGTGEGTALANDMELAAAAVMVASMGDNSDTLPAHLRQKLLADAQSYSADDNVIGIDTARPEASGGRGATMFAGWAIAAALLIALIVKPDAGDAPVPDVTTPVAESASIELKALQAAPGTVTLAWNPPEAEGFENVTGDVVWNNAQQKGYMRLAGMPVNDPAVSQYQLWIVDPERDTNPIDGGVFDIVAANGDVLIPIDAKLSVITPKAFAITREKPGGVVVSGGPLLVVAAI